jgi:hypothetical protein
MTDRETDSDRQMADIIHGGGGGGDAHAYANARERKIKF